MYLGKESKSQSQGRLLEIPHQEKPMLETNRAGRKQLHHHWRLNVIFHEIQVLSNSVCECVSRDIS